MKPLISPGETKRFARRVVTHWNRYERRIKHFAGLFVFNGLTPVSFRRFHGSFLFNGLAQLLDLVLRSVEGASRRAIQRRATGPARWIILRDAALRTAPQNEVRGRLGLELERHDHQSLVF